MPSVPAARRRASMSHVQTDAVPDWRIAWLLPLLVWVTHFWHARQFGVYEDDWNRIPYLAGVDLHGFLHVLHDSAFRGDFAQGRPLHPLLIDAVAFLGLKTGTLFTLYLFGWAIESANALLFWRLILRVFQDGRLAVLAAISLCLFPADTTQPFLTHALGAQPALTLLLAGLHLYLSGHRAVSYVPAALLLFTYETPYLLFAAAPLLARDTRRKRQQHWVVMTLLLLGAVLFRRITGEDRVSHLAARQLVLGVSNVVTGPLTCLAMYAVRPVEACLTLRGWDWLLVSLAIPGFAGLIAQMQDRNDAAPDSAGHAPGDAARLGLLLLVLAYPLTLTTAGVSIAGRGTRVHLAAAPGASLLVGWMATRILVTTKRKTASQLALASVLGSLLGFGLTVQHDYARGWQEQRAFWTDLVALAPPLHDGDVILVDPTGLRDTRQLLFLRRDLTGVPETRQIHSLDTLLTTLPALYRMPRDWRLPPQVFRMPPGWQQQIITPDERLRLLTIEAPFAFDPASRPPVEPAHATLLLTSDGRLTRQMILEDPRTGRTLTLAAAPGPIQNLPRSPFYRYVIDESGAARTPYVVDRALAAPQR